MNWFVNKLFVLGCFTILLIDLLFNPDRYRYRYREISFK